ncbi:histidine kinase [Hymenobacter sp. BT770]|uniref:sensor histidine kinase n=1 Tax=Hymenobacter sp. BT770 TaxID=2886942 RepID=UPI001D12CB64|nr:histidine kinase [Hymenobacter sp. BT770]MCC3153620.1 histidine kinase [Hymenobacter sp. BT770]MDO3415914.1 histidine kinase [Hymenobacter sp. BT770]
MPSPRLLRTSVQAALTAVVFYYTFVFINQGTIWLFDRGIALELGLVFGYLLVIFWSNQRIAAFFEAHPLSRLVGWQRALLEGLTVFTANFVVSLLTIFLPYWLIIRGLRLQVNIEPARVRMGFVVSNIICLFFYYFVERERSRARLRQELLRAAQLQKENFRAQLELLKSQVDPHFLFNSLNVLNSLIAKDPQLAHQFLDQLATVYRLTLDHSAQPVVSLQAEMQLVEAYLFLMQTRLGANLQFEIELKPEALPKGLPPAALQMLVENAIKHNGSTRQKPLQVRIFTEDEAVVVENNRQPRSSPVASTKLGLNNICSRYRYLGAPAVRIAETPTTFRVALPLLPPDRYEDADN